MVESNYIRHEHNQSLENLNGHSHEHSHDHAHDHGEILGKEEGKQELMKKLEQPLSQPEIEIANEEITLMTPLSKLKLKEIFKNNFVLNSSICKTRKNERRMSSIV